MATFIDLCAGIGGFHQALTNEGHTCVFSSEIDSACQKVYYDNFGINPYGDLTKINIETMPDFEILTAGFPCQPFSTCGLQKGFEDTRGTIFFDILQIIEAKKTKVVILENVKNLIYHDNGNTLKVIINSLEFLEYEVSYKVLNAIDFGLPQNRERLIIVAQKKIKFNFDNIKLSKSQSLQEFLNIEKEISNPTLYLNPKDYVILSKIDQKIQKSGLIFVGYLKKEIWNKTVTEDKKNCQEHTNNLIEFTLLKANTLL